MDGSALVEWNNFLTWLSQRSAPVELAQCPTCFSTKRISYRSRLYGVEEDGSIIVELPLQAERENAFELGQRLELQTVLHGKRMSGDCMLKGTVSYRVEDLSIRNCFRLGPAENPQVRETREHTRTNAIGITSIKPVMLKPQSASHLIEATLVNLGIGGIGVSVFGDFNILNQLRTCDNCTIQLPAWESDTCLAINATIAHITPESSATLYLGMRFSLPLDETGKQIEKRLRRFVAWLQRQQVGRRIA